jgi:hypothetical protein
MARNPPERYRSVAEMKADVDAPEKVHVTGRASRLTVPVPWKRRWRVVRGVLLAMLIPIVLFYLFFLMLSRR